MKTLVAPFAPTFEALTGNAPLSWQSRLFEQHFAGETPLPDVIDLPTGVGKTMVMALWLIARARRTPGIPTRLIYVVDRRTVVDQATDLAEKLIKNWSERKIFDGEPPAVSTLRGQLADNREWSRDPSRPAIIIGTVDLIGSALLFSSYRAGFKTKPLHAGLLGQDSLLVLDEAHLSKPFEKLITSISSFQFGQGSPLKVIRMSATTSGGDTKAFKLEETDRTDPVIEERITAKKTLSITTPREKELNHKLADAAVQSAVSKTVIGKRIVVFVRRPDDAVSIADSIRKHGATKAMPGPYVDAVEVLTGTMRGLERDELVKKPAFTDRWLNGDLKPDDAANQPPVFLISTSAGEVGFDLNADHLVCDAAPIDSMIQRLGRVNRRGKGEATVQLFVEAPKKKEKEDNPKKLVGFDLSVANTLDLLADVTDVSPQNIVALKSSDRWKDKYAFACSPEPTMVDLTDILLDAWSMTSITAPMPGRPEVAPWLRGIADELPHTTIAWRAELDLPGFDLLDLETIEEWFDTHRVLTHETLSVPTSSAAKWFIERWKKLDDKQKSQIGGRFIVIDRAGVKLVTVNEIIHQLGRKNTDFIRNAELILPASFGGIERGKGLLDADAPALPHDKANQAIEEQNNENEERVVSTDVADDHHRYREIIRNIEDGDPNPQALVDGTKPSESARFYVDLESGDETKVRLVSYVPKRERLELGLTRQTLAWHVGLVRKCLDDILSRLDLLESIKLAARLAADFHDHGKNRERWERTVNGTATVGTTDWLHQLNLEGDGRHQCLGKSGGAMKRDPRGYRHEFGSLREFTDEHDQKIAPEVFDLAMHLIASHHGRGRPHFPKGGFDPDCESRSDEIHTDSIRRFARMQRKYGWWYLAWLENLLRCADATASAEQDTVGGTK